MKLGDLGAEHMARPAPKLQQPQSLLVKIGLLGLQKCSATQNVDLPVPHVMDEILEVSRTSEELWRFRAQQGCFVARS